jgi:hypothetical protein
MRMSRLNKTRRRSVPGNPSAHLISFPLPASVSTRHEQNEGGGRGGRRLADQRSGAAREPVRRWAMFT